VRNATTGALVAQIMPPQSDLDFSGLATGDGHTFVATLWLAAGGSCKTWLYQFTLNGQGQPSVLTPFAALPETSQQLNGLAVSQNGQTLAYLTTGCPSRAVADLVVLNIATRQTRQWTVPERNSIGSLSLTANGNLLAYSDPLIKFVTSALYVLPTDAAPGTAASRSRVVARAAQFGSSAEITSDVITPDGSALYFSTDLTGPALAKEGSHETWQLRVADVATGKSRTVKSFAGSRGSVSADPSVRYLLLQLQPALGTASQSVRVARLDIATGQVVYLRAPGIGSGAGIIW
jgi:Tol biopolymer transport system component